MPIILAYINIEGDVTHKSLCEIHQGSLKHPRPKQNHLTAIRKIQLALARESELAAENPQKIGGLPWRSAGSVPGSSLVG